MLLFVYGTLKDGHRLHGCMAGAVLKGPTTTLAEWDLSTDGGYPFMVRGGYKVGGELYEITNQHRVRLDRVEGYPHLFGRSWVMVDGGREMACCYIWHRPELLMERPEETYIGPLIEYDVDKNVKTWVGG